MAGQTRDDRPDGMFICQTGLWPSPDKGKKLSNQEHRGVSPAASTRRRGEPQRLHDEGATSPVSVRESIWRVISYTRYFCDVCRTAPPHPVSFCRAARQLHDT